MSTQVLDAYRLLIADVYELAGASRTTSEGIARRFGRTAAQWHVLSVVSEAEMTVSAVARRLGLSRQAVQRVVNDLLDSDQLSARPNPDDRRAPLVAPTPEGRSTLQQLFDASDANRADLLRRAGVGREDLLQARTTLQRLIGAYRPAEPDTTVR
jgi:DNA-binding MarR family transcriptional regulator